MRLTQRRFEVCYGIQLHILNCLLTVVYGLMMI